jgi:hypothetical protein
MHMKKYLIILTAALMAFACNSSKTKKAAEKDSGDTSNTEAEAPQWSLTEIWRTDTTLRTCESVLYDDASGLLYVSCINGASGEKNGKGYIAILMPDGSVKDAAWVTGLDAPKGMGLYGGKLYVADIDRIVVIDVAAAKVEKTIAVPGASFLNDISVDRDGTVYFSDSNTGWLWTLTEEGPRPWITEGLDRPNGLCVEDSRVLLTSSGSSDLKVIDKATGTFETVTQDIGSGDGLEYTGEEGYYILSSWLGEVFLILPDYNKISLLKTSDQKINSADVGFNEAEKIVYVPTFFDNRVVAYRLVENTVSE